MVDLMRQKVKMKWENEEWRKGVKNKTLVVGEEIEESIPLIHNHVRPHTTTTMSLPSLDSTTTASHSNTTTAATKKIKS